MGIFTLNPLPQEELQGIHHHHQHSECLRPSSLQVATGHWAAYLEVVSSIVFAAAAGTDKGDHRVGWLTLFAVSQCSSASGLVHALRQWHGP